MKDGYEVKWNVKRYAMDKGNKGYLFSLTQPSGSYKTFYYRTNASDNDIDDNRQNDNLDLIPLDDDMDGDGLSDSV